MLSGYRNPYDAFFSTEAGMTEVSGLGVHFVSKVDIKRILDAEGAA